MEYLVKSYSIRKATTEDAQAILDIYSFYVLNSVVTFEIKIPTVQEMKSRIQDTLIHFPWLVYEDRNGTIGGYAYAGKHGIRYGYNWTAETSVYLSEKNYGLGIGQQLYSEIFRILLALGYYKVIARTAGDNQRSIQFHRNMGFQLIGKGSNIGFKLGKWIDVNWFEMDLQPIKDNPRLPLLYSELRNC